MVKDSEKKFELDLSDIKATKTVTKEEDVPAKVTSPIEPTGYIVKTKLVDDKVVGVDLADLTPEEFVGWCKNVYPGEILASDVASRAAKLRVMNNIIRFHELSLLSAKRPSDKDNLIH